MLVLAFLLTSVPVYANDIVMLREQYDDASSRADEIYLELTATREQIEQLERELRDLDELLITAVDDLYRINHALDLTMTILEQAESDLEEAQYNLDRQFESARAWIRAMQEQGSTGLLSIVFQATSMRDFLLRMEYVNNIARHDQEMVIRLEEAMDRVTQMHEDYTRHAVTVDNLRRQQEAYINHLENIENERAVYFEMLRQDEERLAALFALERESADYFRNIWQTAYQAERQRRLDEQRRLEQQQRADREAARRINVENRSGDFQWPVPNYTRVSSHFGYRRHPIRRTQEHHDGVDIAAPSGSDILAAEAGTVIFAGWSGGYGLTVIIDHGNNLHTLYAHNSRNLVSVGDVVTRGEVIARVGSTGVSTGPHLHFEVRVGGVPQNPRNWLNY